MASAGKNRDSNNSNRRNRKERPSAVEIHIVNLKQDPFCCWREGRKIIKKADASVTRRRVETLMVPYEFARQASSSRKLMAEFLADEFWVRENQHKPKAKDILQRSIEFHFNCKVKRGPLYDRCWTYASALISFFDAGVEVDKLHELIDKAGGIERLCRQPLSMEPDGEIRKPRPDGGIEPTQPKDKAGEEVDDDDDSDDDDDGDDEPNQRKDAAQPTIHSNEKVKDRRSSQRTVDLNSVLIIEDAESGIRNLLENTDKRMLKIEARIEIHSDNWARLVFIRSECV